jgi:hypothetical protein
MGNMGKELANPSIPHWITYCTVVVLHARHLLLTRVLEGFYSIIDRRHPAFQIHCLLHVLSLHPCDEQELTYQLGIVASSITVVFEGGGLYEMPTSSVGYAWVASAPFLLILVLQSGVSSCLVVILLLLTSRSRVGHDFIQSTTIP